MHQICHEAVVMFECCCLLTIRTNVPNIMIHGIAVTFCISTLYVIICRSDVGTFKSCWECYVTCYKLPHLLEICQILFSSSYGRFINVSCVIGIFVILIIQENCPFVEASTSIFLLIQYCYNCHPNTLYHCTR